ncbi:MAG TPA: DUF1129 domain-containing protein [Candidatus Limosilactobacillus merdipullorum]|uniref:DUF1129 domain-containing protein n=1 Tax=Candidatus Limosilactobacillus merdipullorum TaxID=2838653 RepID=A0A9D1U365_9LACO|nr:DUF1129 domain-containing protein [Candidatus Limosilactobacillus merdipullorum]
MTEDTKKLNADAAARQKEHLKNVSRQEAGQFTDAGLTRKNEEFMYQLNKQLDAQGVKPDKKPEMIERTMSQLKEAQKTGKTAKQLFGTPTQYAHDLLHPQKGTEGHELSSFKLLFVDNSLMFLAIFAIMYGLLAFFSPNAFAGQTRVGTSGITAMIIISLSGGAAFAYMAKATQPVKNKKTGRWVRKPLGRRFLYIAAAFVVWLVIYYLCSLLPNVINPQMNKWAYVIIGVLAFVGDMYFRRVFNIVGSAFARQGK